MRDSSSPEAPVAGLSMDRILVGGMAWTAVFRWIAQAISWIGTAMAARLLTPGDYGLAGMAMLAIGLVRMVEDFGMDSVLVQDRAIGGIRQARLAGFILLSGLALCAAFLVLSGPVATFFNEPQVVNLVSALSLLCVFDAVQVVPRALLQREMQFRKLAVLQFVQVLATQVVLVTAASMGAGVWSLVLNALGGAVAGTVLLLWWRPFKLAWPRELRTLARPMLQGWRILASRFSWYAYTSADQAIIGRLLGKEALGTYSFAMTFSTIVSQEISSVLSKVVPGVFSAVQARHDELRRYFVLLTELLSTLTLPVALGMIVIADLVVALVLGPQWNAVVPPLRILSLYAAFYSCQVLVGHVLLWTGRFRASMWCSLLAAVVLPVGFYVGSHWGLAGIAWAWALLFPPVNLPAFVIAFRVIRANGWTWLGAFLPSLSSSLAMSAAVMLLRSVLAPSMPLPLSIAACVLTGAAVYAAVMLFVFGGRIRALWGFLRVIRS